MEIRDQDLLLDDLLATVYTDDEGRYSVNVTSGWGDENPDIFVTADWHFELPASEGKHVVLVDTAMDCETPGVPFTSKSTDPENEHDPMFDLPVEILRMDQARADVEDLRAHISNSLDYHRINRGNIPWSFTDDVPVTIATGTIQSRAGEERLCIAEADITGNSQHPAGAGFISDVYHEVAHMVHFRFNGGVPPHGGIRDHDVNTETDPGFALTEGWASYVAYHMREIYPTDNKYNSIVDLRLTHWRGDEPRPTGYENNNFESGELVEGALGGAWSQLHATDGGFYKNFGSMVERKPDNIFEFLDTYVRRSGGNGSLGAILAYAAFYDHGIPYSRARFESNAFTQDEPSDQGPPEAGNVREIDGKLFLRGKVKSDFSFLAGSELGVQTTLDVEQVGVYFKPAISGIGESASGFSSFLGAQPATNSFHEIDTLQLGGTRGDGEWDLVIFGENEDGFRDSLRPAWGGDGNSAVDSDEKYLKTIGAWYDGDRDPTTEDDGKVVVDNTAPKVENFKPEP